MKQEARMRQKQTVATSVRFSVYVQCSKLYKRSQMTNIIQITFKQFVQLCAKRMGHKTKKEIKQQ